MSADAHQRLVRKVMDALHAAEEDERLDCSNIAHVAIEVVAAIGRERNWLLYNGDVRMVEAIKTHNEEGEYDHNSLIVQIVPDTSGLRCKWCGKPYGSKESGAGYDLCSYCYNYGPSETVTS